MEQVIAELLRLDPRGSRWARVIRHTYDMIYNGQETGRYSWSQLMKTEKTHFGTLFEINAQREFEFESGDTTDYRIAGHQVDAKWSQSQWGWMLPPEVINELALVATGSDLDSTWSLGLIRITPDVLRSTVNRDRKSQLNNLGRRGVHWVWREAPLRPNILLQLPSETVEEIMSLKHGTQRTNELFRAAEGQIVNRSAVATVSRQLDHQKRVRYNGGARSALQPEGIIILSGVYHQALAKELGVPIPQDDEYVSVKVVPTDDPTGTKIDGHRWRRARAGEIANQPAPRLIQ